MNDQTSKSALHLDPIALDYLKTFGPYIRRRFKNLPLDQYSVPEKLYKQLDDEIIDKGHPSTSILQKIVIDMEKHLGFGCMHCIVSMEKLGKNCAGYIEKESYDFNFVSIGYEYFYSADNYIAIIAHELSHAYQYKNGWPRFEDESKAEIFTDVLTAYLGFGLYTISGKKTYGTNVSVTLGYLEEGTIPTFMWDADKTREEKEIAAKRKKALSNLRANYLLFNTYIDAIIDTIGRLSKTEIRNQDDLVEFKKASTKYTIDYKRRVISMIKGIGSKDDEIVFERDKQILNFTQDIVRDYQTMSLIEANVRKRG